MINLGNPRTGEREIEAIGELLRDGDLSTGATVSKFEDEFADFIGREHGVAVCSGSEALELGFEVSDLEAGDRVALSPFNCAAMLYSLLRQNLEPVFCDIEPDTFNISADHLREVAANERLDGVLVAHLYGQPCDMDEIMQISEEFGLTVIDDIAQSPGARFDGRNVGTYGEIGICSFGATKNLTTAEGGMVLTDDEETKAELEMLRSNAHGDYQKPLRSVRMNDLEAAIGREQLEQYFEEIVPAKRKTANLYRSRLSDIVRTPPEKEDRTHVYHGFSIRTERNRELMEFLDRNDIETSIVYDTPLYDYTLAPNGQRGRCPETERASNEVLLLPIHSRVSPADARRVATKVAEFFR